MAFNLSTNPGTPRRTLKRSEDLAELSSVLPYKCVLRQLLLLSLRDPFNGIYTNDFSGLQEHGFWFLSRFASDASDRLLCLQHVFPSPTRMTFARSRFVLVGSRAPWGHREPPGAPDLRRGRRTCSFRVWTLPSEQRGRASWKSLSTGPIQPIGEVWTKDTWRPASWDVYTCRPVGLSRIYSPSLSFAGVPHSLPTCLTSQLVRPDILSFIFPSTCKSMVDRHRVFRPTAHPRRPSIKSNRLSWDGGVLEGGGRGTRNDRVLQDVGRFAHVLAPRSGF